MLLGRLATSKQQQLDRGQEQEEEEERRAVDPLSAPVKVDVLPLGQRAFGGCRGSISQRPPLPIAQKGKE